MVISVILRALKIFLSLKIILFDQVIPVSAHDTLVFRGTPIADHSDSDHCQTNK